MREKSNAAGCKSSHPVIFEKMKYVIAVLTFVHFLTPLAAQNPEAGFLKVVNLVSLKTPTYIRLGKFEFDDGRPVAAGDDSGTLALIPDTYTITVTNAGAKPKSASVDFETENARNVVVMCYDEQVERKDGSIVSKLKFTLLTEAPADDKPRVSIVSLLKQTTVPVSIDGKTTILADRNAHRIEPEIEDTIEIRVDNKDVGEIEITKPTHYLAFLYRDPETNEVALSLIQNEKLEYHPPLDEDE